VPVTHCEKRNCRSRNPKAVWLIDGKRYCHSCGEAQIELKGVDQLRIHRLSDKDRDFPERLDPISAQPIGA